MDSLQSFFITANQLVRQSGVANFKGCRLQIPSNFNFEFLEQQLGNYDDKVIIDLLKYGFPLGHNGKTGVTTVVCNHLGARAFKKEIAQILDNEIKRGAVIGPFKDPLFREPPSCLL